MRNAPLDAEVRAIDVTVGRDAFTLHLADGRRLSVPWDWSPRLLAAKGSQRQHWQLLGHGEGIHWPDVDEDLSVDGLLAGQRSRERR
ncbi:MAG: DUF2442 domain-containing protein [Planctomycetota bacterium]